MEGRLAAYGGRSRRGARSRPRLRQRIESSRWVEFTSQPSGGVTAATRILRIADHSPGLALDTPFLLLPFRPSSDPSAARTFVRNYFNQSFDQGAPVSGDALMQELRLTEPMVRKTTGCFKMATD